MLYYFLFNRKEIKVKDNMNLNCNGKAIKRIHIIYFIQIKLPPP